MKQVRIAELKSKLRHTIGRGVSSALLNSLELVEIDSIVLDRAAQPMLGI
jgi:hypothetical protein